MIPDHRPLLLERSFLSKGIPGKRGALRALGDLYAHRRRFGSGDAGRSEHGVLGEDFVVDLGDEVILPVGFAPPDLPELDGIHGHDFFLDVGSASRVPGWSEPSIARKVTEGQGLTTYFASGLSGAVGNHKASVAMMSGDRRIAERNSCRAELFLVSQPEPDARIE